MTNTAPTLFSLAKVLRLGAIILSLGNIEPTECAYKQNDRHIG